MPLQSHPMTNCRGADETENGLVEKAYFQMGLLAASFPMPDPHGIPNFCEFRFSTENSMLWWDKAVTVPAFFCFLRNIDWSRLHDQLILLSTHIHWINLIIPWVKKNIFRYCTTRRNHTLKWSMSWYWSKLATASPKLVTTAQYFFSFLFSFHFKGTFLYQLIEGWVSFFVYLQFFFPISC